MRNWGPSPVARERERCRYASHGTYVEQTQHTHSAPHCTPTGRPPCTARTHVEHLRRRLRRDGRDPEAATCISRGYLRTERGLRYGLIHTYIRAVFCSTSAGKSVGGATLCIYTSSGFTDMRSAAAVRTADIYIIYIHTYILISIHLPIDTSTHLNICTPLDGWGRRYAKVCRVLYLL